MATPSSKPAPNASAPRSKQSPTYISSSGQTLDSLPLSTRLNRSVDTVYNFLGLYLVSLLSLDPFSAAQNSRFNTRGPSRPMPGSANTTGRTGGAGTSTSSWFGGAGRSGGSGTGPRGGTGGGSGGSGPGSGRRMGTVDDVRGPECGSGSCG